MDRKCLQEEHSHRSGTEMARFDPMKKEKRLDRSIVHVIMQIKYLMAASVWSM
jgi:hypothetical protein